MKAFLASILTVIAMGVSAIAYGVLSPRMAAADAYSSARPVLASERVGVVDDGTGLYNYPNNGVVRYTPNGLVAARPVAYETYAPAPRRVARRASTTQVVERRARGRDWKKTALVIGGTTATGAGLGAIFGGKKGALIGAAIG